MVKLPNVPNVPIGLDPELRDFLQAIKDILEIVTSNRGGEGSKFVTREQLENLGIDIKMLDEVEPQYDFSSLF